MTQEEMQVITTVYADGPCSIEHVVFDLMFQLNMPRPDAYSVAKHILRTSRFVTIESDEPGFYYCVASCDRSPL